MTQEEIAQDIVDIIDSKIKYSIQRRPYDEVFAAAYDLTLEEVQSQVRVPCLWCGKDITQQLMTPNKRGMLPVFCSKRCRSLHGIMRMTKLDETTDINAMAKQFVRWCVQAVPAPGEVLKSKRNARRVISTRSVVEALDVTNDLLKSILEELRHARKT